MSPEYLMDCCTLVSDVAGRRHLRSVSRQQFVPRYRLISFGRRAFSVAEPTAWNMLPSDSEIRHESWTVFFCR